MYTVTITPNEPENILIADFYSINEANKWVEANAYKVCKIEISNENEIITTGFIPELPAVDNQP
jgi:hypothetical protein